jgi:hypothetical protein
MASRCRQGQGRLRIHTDGVHTITGRRRDLAVVEAVDQALRGAQRLAGILDGTLPHPSPRNAPQSHGQVTPMRRAGCTTRHSLMQRAPNCAVGSPYNRGSSNHRPEP